MPKAVGIAHPQIRIMTTLNNTFTHAFGLDATQDTSQYPSAVPTYQIPRERFAEIAKTVKTAGVRLVAEWATDESPFGRGFGIYACYAKDS